MHFKVLYFYIITLHIVNKSIYFINQDLSLIFKLKEKTIDEIL